MKNNFFELVSEFIEATDTGVLLDQKSLDELRTKLFDEEYNEFQEAWNKGEGVENVSDILDAFVDMFYIAEGSIYLMAGRDVVRQQVEKCKEVYEQVVDWLSSELTEAKVDDVKDLIYKCFIEVHLSNMRKLVPQVIDGETRYLPIINDGIINKNQPIGKILKPSGWQPPNLEKVYEDWFVEVSNRYHYE